MRKLIDIPDEIVKDLKISAAFFDKDLKNYIQDLIIQKHESLCVWHTNRSEIKAIKDLDPLLKDFEKLGLQDTPMKFESFIDGGFYYELNHDSSLHRIYVISDHMVFEDQMSIKDILFKTPFYISHEVFYKKNGADQMIHKFEFSITETDEYKKRIGNFLND